MKLESTRTGLVLVLLLGAIAVHQRHADSGVAAPFTSALANGHPPVIEAREAPVGASASKRFDRAEDAAPVDAANADAQRASCGCG